MKKCPDCNSEKIIKNAKTLDRGDYNAALTASIAVEEYPDAVIFKNPVYSETDADVCGECGFIQFYAKDPETLWAAYQNREASSKIDEQK
jgi:hypothetical protein